MSSVGKSAVRVLLDATAVPADRGGVGRYVDNVAPALVRAGVDLTIACQPADAELFAGFGADAVPVVRVAGRGSRLIWEQTGLVALSRSLRPDVLHSPHYTQPQAVRAASAVTLHDATFFTDPNVHGRVKGPFFRAATRRAVRRCDALIVPSRATADELVRVAAALPASLHVAHHGVDAALFHAPGAVARDRARAGLGLAAGQAYVAFLGTLEPRKNLSALVRGYVLACADRPSPPALVLAGGAGWDAALDAAIAAVPAPLEVLRPGYLPIEDLAGYLGGAVLVVYPSLGEGFGLPLLEAMACGAPALTTRRLSLPEVGGDAVAYCDVDDASIAAALRRLLDDPAQRAALGSAAAERARLFTWDACAAAHIAAYEAAMRVHHARGAA
jgi:glycosyltransferase involved in cell wall biosynthesis